ncbi:MAG: ATP-binding protein [Bacteroidota bacterium]
MIIFGLVMTTLTQGQAYIGNESSQQAQILRASQLNQQAYQTYRKDVKKAKQYAEEALSISQHLQIDSLEVSSYLNLGRCFRLLRKIDSAFWALDTALQLAQSAGYLSGLVAIHNNLGILYIHEEAYDKAESSLLESLKDAQTVGDLKGEAHASLNLAIIAEQEVDYYTAFTYQSRAEALFRTLKDSIGISRSLSNQAYIYELTQLADSAIKRYYEALSIQDALDMPYEQGATLTQLALMFDKVGLVEKALETHLQSLTLREAIPDMEGVTEVCLNIGNLLAIENRPEEAMFYLHRGLHLASESNDLYMVSKFQLALADFHIYHSHTYDSARFYLAAAEDLLNEWNPWDLTHLFHQKGDLARKQGKLNQAIPFFQQELDTAVVFGDLQGQQFALGILSELAREQNDPAQALVYLDAYQQVQDSIDKQATARALQGYEIVYQSEKKAKENALLQFTIQAQRSLYTQLLVGGILLLIVGVGVFIAYRARQRLILRERNFELEQAQVRQAQRKKEVEKLQEIDAMKSRFFTNISHEFRTPLSLILGQNERLQQILTRAEQKESFQMVDRNVQRLLDLINQVMDLAKLEAGGMKLERMRLDVIPFCKQTFYAFESEALELGISLHFESLEQEYFTAFDVPKVERILFNLLSNAIKFTREGGRVSLKVQKEQQDLVFRVEDTGKGIGVDELPYIFDQFYQAKSSENQAQPGTGIGLALVKELVELHQGEISVQSQLDEGTTFEVRLPIPDHIEEFPQAIFGQELMTTALPNAQNREIAPTSAPFHPDPTRILVVEDNPDVRELITAQLVWKGYQVMEAVDGRGGLRLAKEHLPDLVLADIMMPKMDGYELVQRLRQHVHTSHIPIILITSKASEESKQKGYVVGADDYLLKPFKIETMYIRIANLIEQRQRLRQRFSEALVIKPEEVSVTPVDQAFLQKVFEIIRTHLSDEQFGAAMLSEELAMSPTHLNRKLRSLIDQTAGKLIRSMRLQHAAEFLKQQGGSIAEIAYQVGFADPAHFSRAFKQQFGQTPRAYMTE